MRSITRNCLLGLLLMFAHAPRVTAGTVATYSFGAGWATFGLALPQGAAVGGVQVGSLATQTDVKTRWPDGSIRFAVVTAQIATAGSYAITSSTASTGSFTPTMPAASVRLTIGGQVWVANLPSTSTDMWLSGPRVVDRRALVTPVAGATPHGFLRVLFDVRSYNGGGHRVDVTVENSLDVAAADRVTYDVAVIVAGSTLFQKTAVSHAYLARWRKVFRTGLQEAAVTPDFTPFLQANAFPSYLSTIDNDTYSTAGSAFDILKIGSLHDPMNDHGGRPELGPLPAWTAQYLVHRQPQQLAFVLAHGDLAGTYSMHIKEPDGVRMISIDDHPNYWLDSRADPDGRPKNGVRGLGYNPDIAHQPSLAYVPYLVTGDRYYLDEMKFWANYCLIGTAQDAYYNARNGSEGLLKDNEVRGIGWGVRNIADAAAYTPDNDPYKAYFREKLINNLEWLENYALTFQTPLNSLWTGKRPEDYDQPPYVWIALWEHVYVAWAVDHALYQGFSPGAALRDRVVKFQLKLFTSDAAGFPKAYGAPYILAVGTNASSPNYFTTMSQVFSASFGGQPPIAFAGAYGPEARLMLLIAKRLNLTGADSAITYLMGAAGMTADINNRSGWAIAPAGSTPPPPPPPPPCSPSISPASRSFTAAAGSGSITLTTTCGWTASTTASWITIGTTSGTGSATVGYNVAANTTGAARTGVVTVAGLSHTITQQACVSTAPAITAQPTNQTVTGGQTALFTVGVGVSVCASSAPAYRWQGSSNGGASWLNLSEAPPYSGTTGATLTVTTTNIAPNATRYRVIVSNASGSATSGIATLTLMPSRDDLIVAFGSASGLWARDGAASTWARLHTASAKRIVVADLDGSGIDEVVGDFGTAGIWVWENNTRWYLLHTATSAGMTSGDFNGDGKADLLIDFAAFGVWVWFDNASWSRLHASSAANLLAVDLDGNGQDEAVIDFPGFGIWVWKNNTSWSQLHASNARHIVAADLDATGKPELIIDFAGFGLWTYSDQGSWALLHASSASYLAAGDVDGDGTGDLIVDFGSQYGIWTLVNGTTWRLLHAINSAGLLTTDLDRNGRADVVINFGTLGIWTHMNDTGWMQLHTAGAAAMAAGHVNAP